LRTTSTQTKNLSREDQFLIAIQFQCFFFNSQNLFKAPNLLRIEVGATGTKHQGPSDMAIARQHINYEKKQQTAQLRASSRPPSWAVCGPGRTSTATSKCCKTNTGKSQTTPPNGP